MSTPRNSHRVCLVLCLLVACTDAEELQAPAEAADSAIFFKKEKRCRRPPTNLTAEAVDAEVRLAWIDNSKRERGFAVQRKSGGSDFKNVAVTGPNITAYAETVAPGTYTYRVAALPRHLRPHHPRKICLSNEVTVTVNVEAGRMSYVLAPLDAETEASIVIAGNSGVTLGRFVLRAEGEDLMQDALRFGLPLSESGASVAGLSLYDGPTLVAGPVPIDSAGNADFDDMNFIVPKDGSKTLTAKADLNAIADGAVSGDNLLIALDLSNPAPGTFRYHGLSSGQATETIDRFDLTGEDKVVRKTKPTVSLASLPTSALSNDMQVLARFTVTAEADGRLSVMSFTVDAALANVGGDDLALSDFAVREVAQGTDIPLTQAETLGACSVAGADSGICNIRITFDREQGIAAGASKTYELRAVVAGADTSGEAVSTTLLEEEYPLRSVFASLTGELQSGRTRFFNVGSLTQFAPNWVWSDQSDPGHNDTYGTQLGVDNPDASNDWTTGRLVRSLPLDAQTLAH